MAHERLSERFERMRAACAGGEITLRALLPGLRAQDHGLIALLVAICFMHPLPMPGVSWGLSFLLIASGARLIAGKGLWLPLAVLDKRVPARLPGKVFGWAAAAFRKTEALIRPRGRIVADHGLTAKANGAAMILCGLMLVTPLPPPTNYPPAIALLLLSLGMLESDLLMTALGHAATLASVALFVSLAVFGYAGLRGLLARL